MSEGNIFGRPTEVASDGNIRVESNSSSAAELRAVLDLPKDADAETNEPEARTAPTSEAPRAVSDAVPAPDVETEPTEAEQDQLGLRQRNSDGTFKKIKAKKRIEELLGKHRVAEARATAAEAEITRLRAESDAARRAPVSATAKATTEPGDFSRPKPTIHDFASDPDPYASLAEGLTDWKLEQRDFQQRKDSQAQQARINAEQSDRVSRERLASFNARLEDARQKHADFDAVIDAAAAHAIAPSPRWQADFNQGISLSSEGPDILFELAKNPEEFQRLTTVEDKGELFLALGQIGARLASRRESAATGSTAPVASSARPPIRPPRGGPQKTEDFPDEATMSVSEIARRDREKMAASFNAHQGRV